jgi:lipoyl(octanoyl) transferase
VKSAKSLPWRVAVDGPLSGEVNMRRDAARLEELRAPNARPVLRFFEWERPTVTYGRLQSEEKARAYGKACGTEEVVRRPTGGGMVLHNKDLSFSLVWRRGEPLLPDAPKAVYRAVHELARRALSGCGIETEFYRSASRGGGEGVCFVEPVENDLMWNGTKVLGGALRVTAWGRLYQGNLTANVWGAGNGAFIGGLSGLFEREASPRPPAMSRS